MIHSLIGGKEVIIRPFASYDYQDLVSYYDSFNSLTKSRFAPHSFDRNGLGEVYWKNIDLVGYVAVDLKSSLIVAYAVVKLGFYIHDKQRFENYGISLNEFSDCFYAPSVADDWQGHGLGKAMFNFVLDDIRLRSIKRIFLWGGVQILNINAVSFYNRLGFETLGDFEHEGLNRDMIYLV